MKHEPINGDEKYIKNVESKQSETRDNLNKCQAKMHQKCSFKESETPANLNNCDEKVQKLFLPIILISS